MREGKSIADVLEGRADWIVVTGDCLAVLPSIPAGSVGAVVTDPPYSSGGAFRADRTQTTDAKYQHTAETNRNYATFSGDNRDQRSFEAWCRMWMAECLRASAEGAVFASFIDWRNLASLTDAVQVAGWVYRGVVPWHKGWDQRPRKGWFRANVEYVVLASCGPILTGHLAEGRCADGVIYVRVNGVEKEHQTGKPVEVCEELLTVREDKGLVIDPFAGSGTTGLAALRTGRRFIGIEIDPGYADIARRRIREAEPVLFTQAAKPEQLTLGGEP